MAVTEQVLEAEGRIDPPVRGRSRFRPGRRLLLTASFCASLALGAGAVVGGLAVFHGQEAGRILPGVSIAGIDVGGLTAADARAALTAHLADLSAGAVTIRSGIGSTSVS